MYLGVNINEALIILTVLFSPPPCQLPSGLSNSLSAFKQESNYTIIQFYKLYPHILALTLQCEGLILFNIGTWRRNLGPTLCINKLDWVGPQSRWNMKTYFQMILEEKKEATTLFFELFNIRNTILNNSQSAPSPTLVELTQSKDLHNCID